MLPSQRGQGASRPQPPRKTLYARSRRVALLSNLRPAQGFSTCARRIEFFTATRPQRSQSSEFRIASPGCRLSVVASKNHLVVEQRRARIRSRRIMELRTRSHAPFLNTPRRFRRLTPRRVAISRRDPCHRAGGQSGRRPRSPAARPMRAPWALAFFIPARTRSRISSRSNSAIEPMMLNMSRPLGCAQIPGCR